jgi:AcrR family transcriptional regulator
MSDEKLDTQVRREQIAEAALGLIASHGLKRLSVAGVARRVGLVPSGIYRHFKSKNEIVVAVLDLIDRRLQAIVDAALAESEEPLDRLRGILMRHIRFIREGRAIPRIIFSDDVHEGMPDGKARIVGIMRGYLGRVAEVIRQGQQQGTISSDLEPETSALMFFGIVMPAGILWHVTDGGFDVTKHAERAWRIYTRGLGVPDA